MPNNLGKIVVAAVARQQFVYPNFKNPWRVETAQERAQCTIGPQRAPLRIRQIQKLARLAARQYSCPSRQNRHTYSSKAADGWRLFPFPPSILSQTPGPEIARPIKSGWGSKTSFAACSHRSLVTEPVSPQLGVENDIPIRAKFRVRGRYGQAHPGVGELPDRFWINPCLPPPYKRPALLQR